MYIALKQLSTTIIFITIQHHKLVSQLIYTPQTRAIHTFAEVYWSGGNCVVIYGFINALMWLTSMPGLLQWEMLTFRLSPLKKHFLVSSTRIIIIQNHSRKAIQKVNHMISKS